MLHLPRCFLLLSLGALVVHTLTAEIGAVRKRDPTQREVFRAGEEGYFCFRIPALIFTSRSTLLAFAEGRGRSTGSCADHGDVRLVLKRSKDLGATWSNISVVHVESGHTIGWRCLLAHSMAEIIIIIRFYPGNPAPVLEELSGKVILLFSRDNKQIFTIESGDEGVSWGVPRNISASTTNPEWGFVATGPPGGIQLPSGRIIIGIIIIQ